MMSSAEGASEELGEDVFSSLTGEVDDSGDSFWAFDLTFWFSMPAFVITFRMNFVEAGRIINQPPVAHFARAISIAYTIPLQTTAPRNNSRTGIANPIDAYPSVHDNKR
jgi:hypothetical protein